jgi:hypothetical protein
LSRQVLQKIKARHQLAEIGEVVFVKVAHRVS